MCDDDDDDETCYKCCILSGIQFRHIVLPTVSACYWQKLHLTWQIGAMNQHLSLAEISIDNLGMCAEEYSYYVKHADLLNAIKPKHSLRLTSSVSIEIKEFSYTHI